MNMPEIQRPQQNLLCFPFFPLSRFVALARPQQGDNYEKPPSLAAKPVRPLKISRQHVSPAT